MIIHKFRKLIASVLFIALTSTMIPCNAANLVPFNGAKPIVTPAVPITNPEANNSTDCEKCTFDEAIDLKDKEGYLCINPDNHIFVPKWLSIVGWIGMTLLYMGALGLGICCGKCCYSCYSSGCSCCSCCTKNTNTEEDLLKSFYT